MKKMLIALVLLAGCASKTSSSISSSDAQRDIEERYKNRIGSATKQDFVQEFGPANWCRAENTGDENCRFRKKIGTVWMGDKDNRTHRETFDEVVAEFDSSGTLKSFKATAQR